MPARLPTILGMERRTPSSSPRAADAAATTDAAAADAAPSAHGTTAHDTTWPRQLRDATVCAAVLLVLLLALDACTAGLTAARAVLWAGISVLLFLVLLPPRVSAGAGWLSSRGLVREQRVRTDRLLSARWSDGVSQRLVLRDVDGRRVEIDPRILVANPRLWNTLDTDARTSLDRGTLLCGATALRQLARRIDGETAKAVFQVSELT